MRRFVSIISHLLQQFVTIVLVLELKNVKTSLFMQQILWILNRNVRLFIIFPLKQVKMANLWSRSVTNELYFTRIIQARFCDSLTECQIVPVMPRTKSPLQNYPVNQTECNKAERWCSSPVTFCSRRDDLSIQNIKIGNDSELKCAL